MIVLIGKSHQLPLPIDRKEVSKQAAAPMLFKEVEFLPVC